MPGRILDRHVGGNTTYARSLAAGLAARGHEVRHLPFARHPVGTLLLESREALRRGDGDILHYVADTGALVRSRRPSVVTVHGIASHRIDGVRSARAEAAWRFRVGRALRSADRVVTVSASSARDIAEVFGTDPGRIRVIPHGIDAEAFGRPAELSAGLRARVPERFVLYVGNIEPRKNLDALVRAFARPDLARLGIPLLVAGKPAWDFKDTMELMERTPNVHHLGFVSDADRTALMQRCAAFVFPSRYEGFGFPVLEALAAGAVVLTSREGSLAEVAGPSLPLAGLSADDVAEGVLRALTDTAGRDACLRDGRAWASSFSWDRSVEAHLEVYRAAGA